VVAVTSSAKFWDKIADKYSKQPVSDEAAYQKKLQITRDYLRPDMEMIEIGCGTGATAIAHAPFVKHIHAIDISSNMIEIAKSKANAEKITTVTFEQSTIDDLRVPDQTIDIVLALSVLHLVESKEDVIAKIHNMLKPGGIFISSTACLGDKMGFFKLIAPVGKFLGFLPLLKVFTKQNLLDSIVDAGFHLDHQWQPEKAIAVFVVAKKPE